MVNIERKSFLQRSHLDCENGSLSLKTIGTKIKG